MNPNKRKKKEDFKKVKSNIKNILSKNILHKDPTKSKVSFKHY